jgi:acyl carrier protein
MTASTEERVVAIIASSAGLDASMVTPQATLQSLGVTSLDAIEIIFDIEESFGVTLPDRAPDFEADTVGGLIDAVGEALRGVDAIP